MIWPSSIPAIIFGPLLGPEHGTSVGLIQQMMSGKLKRVPRFGFSVVDVRDAADAHIRAMTHPERPASASSSADSFSG